MPGRGNPRRRPIWLLALLLLSSCQQAPRARRVFILAVDGLDPRLLERFMAAGQLPHFERLAAEGGFRPLQTTMPPLSPVAWSTFITGMDPGGHGIFDFVHRRPQTMAPFLSMSRVEETRRGITLGSWFLPLGPPRVELLRKGRAFWEMLEENGVPTNMFRMPANFPPVPATRSLSGMGTPDILGTPGLFSLYTDDPDAGEGDVDGGRIFRVPVREGRVRARLVGPRNTFRWVASPAGPGSERVHPRLGVDFTVDLDPPGARFQVQEQEFVLEEGEWSDWIPLSFRARPYPVRVASMARFYLQQAAPRFRLYVSPLQIDPDRPALPISTPRDWSSRLVRSLGRFYTQELPEDTKAFSAGVLDGEEFWEQSQLVFEEQRRALEHSLEGFQEGLLFFYFSTLDQVSHMFWRYQDPGHPDFQESEELSGGLETLYRQIDAVLGRARQKLDEEVTVIVMSDHGFAPFTRGVNLNSWLLEKGYVRLRDPARRGQDPFFQNVDWTGTRAYALGLNGIYLNLEGRERTGVVPAPLYRELVDRLERELLSMEDPGREGSPVTRVVQPRRDFQGPYRDAGPDLIVGYNRGYRSSWRSPLGEFPPELFEENRRPWSGDHAMDSRLVPGVLVANRRITLESPSLADLTVAVLDEYGVPAHAGMLGRDCLASPAGERGE